MKTLQLLSILVFSFLNLKGQQIAIRNVNVIDLKSGKLLPGYSIFISNNKISWIGSDKKVRIDNQTTVVDGKGKYLMPGLIDSHIHFSQSGSLYTRPDAVDFTNLVPYEDERKRGFENTTDYLKRYLRLGITTVMDLGGPFSNFTIRDSISKTIISPNVLVTGPLFSIVESSGLALNDPPIVKVASNEDVDRLFNKMLPFKPDFIKVWYISGKEYPAEKSFPLVKYIAGLSSQNNLKLAVHATELKTAQLAVEAGANILVHSVEDEIIPDEFVNTLKDKNVTYIPTLMVSGNYSKAFSGKLPHHPQDLAWANAFAYGSLTDVEAMDTASLPRAIKWYRKQGIPQTDLRYDSVMRVNLRKLVNAGVNVATGTDAGNIGTFHASSYIQELEAMQGAGLSNIELLKASTMNAASGFGISDKYGSVEKGKKADLLLLQKNPLEAITNLNSVELIFKDGKIIKADTLVNESAEAIVQRQVNAYNARNIDGFMATYSQDIEIYDAKGKLLIKGHKQMREGYEGFFKNTENLYCQIENRIVINNKVIDKEKVRAGKEIIHAVAIYEVEADKIIKVTFLD
jgi:imidazolonepropionase-like amidohydrolase